MIDGKQKCRTVQLSEEVALNIGEGERLVGIEILDAKEVLGSGATPVVVLEGLLSSNDSLLLREKPARYGKQRTAHR